MRLPAIIKADYVRKLVAILFALIIWLFVRLKIQEEEIFRNIPVHLEYGQEQVVLDQKLPAATVTVRGSKRRLNMLSNIDLRVVGKISRKAYGHTDVPLLRTNVVVPQGVHVVEVQPERVSVFVDRFKTAERDIRLSFSGHLPAEYDFKTREVVPRRAQVTGPATVVDDLAQVVTVPVSLGDNPPPKFEQVVALQTTPQVNLSPAEVKVSIELYRKQADKFFPALPLYTVNSQDSPFFVAAFQDPAEPKVEAVIQGPKATIDVLTESSLRAFVDLSDITEAGTYRKPVHLWINADECRILTLEPFIFELKIGRRNVAPPQPQ